MTDEERKQEYEKWFNERPKVIQDLITQFPFDKQYRIKEGAPYELSCPGTKVSIVSYVENGNINVAVMAEDKLPAAREHEKKLCEQHGKDYETISRQNVKVEVNPMYLEQID